MIETITFKGKVYPKFQTEGFAAQFAFPFADKVCKGVGFDIGCNRKEWVFGNSIPIDLNFGDGFDAMNLPHIDGGVDYIFSSHCLEHLDDWISALDYWIDNLKSGGVLFLYLPDYSQEYWRPWNNRKHKHVMVPEIVRDFMRSKNMANIFVSGVDLNMSFYAIGEKI